MSSKSLTVTITAKAINRGRIPIVASLAMRVDAPETPAPANSRVARKAISAIAAAMLTAVPIPRTVTVVTVVTVVIVVIIFLRYGRNIIINSIALSIGYRYFFGCLE